MQNRNPIVVVLLTFVTLGIYYLVWHVQTGREMRKLGASIPTAWLLVVPIVSLYQWWMWCGGVARVTEGRTSQGLAVVLTLFLGPLGAAIIQSNFNSLPAK